MGHESIEEAMQTVELNARVVGKSSRQALIVLHGLFGSSRNWSQLADRFARQYHVHALDLRNHGASPHDPLMDYPVLSADVLAYLKSQQIQTATILGHSMGGKVAMWLALSEPDYVQKLIIVDIAPVSYPDERSKLFQGLKRLPLSELSSRLQADTCLSEYIDEKPVRQFLLQNLVNQSVRYRWRIPIDYIERSIQRIDGFPDVSMVEPFRRPALFIGGKQSSYLCPHSHQIISMLFPACNIEMVDHAGHWVHAEQPDKVLDLVKQFELQTTTID